MVTGDLLAGKRHGREAELSPLFIVEKKFRKAYRFHNRLCGLVVKVLGYRFGGPGSSPSTTRKKNSRYGTGSTQPREYN
jgi:hypothetical protein